MRYLLAPIGSAGDVFPFLGLGQALQARGHQVVVISNDFFRPVAEKIGLATVSLGDAETYRQVAHDPKVWHAFHGPRHVLRWATKLIEPLDTAIRECGSPQDSIVISSCLGWGARVAQERDGYRLITIDLQPSALLSAEQPPRLPGLCRRAPPWWNRTVLHWAERLLIHPVCRPQIEQYRARWNLPPIRRLSQWWRSPDCVLGLFPEWYAPPPSDWPSAVSLTQFPLWDAGADESMSEEVKAFLDGGDRPVVATPGSANPFGWRMLELASRACDQLGLRLVWVSRFTQGDRISRSANLMPIEYVPFSKLLPHAAVVIHHGGIGTVARCLAAGVPQIICPFSHDQPDNGRRIEELGMGRVLTANMGVRLRSTHGLGEAGTEQPGSRSDLGQVAPPCPHTHGRRWVKRLATILDAIRSDATMTDRCRQFANRIANVSAFDDTCRKIEDFGAGCD